MDYYTLSQIEAEGNTLADLPPTELVALSGELCWGAEELAASLAEEARP